jgi:DNA-binding beta-propeller fold protein YncE
MARSSGRGSGIRPHSPRGLQIPSLVARLRQMNDAARVAPRRSVKTGRANQKHPKMRRLPSLLLAMVLLLLAAACDNGPAQPTTDRVGKRSPAEARSSPSPTEPAASLGGRKPDEQVVWVAIEDAEQVVAVDVRTREVIRRHTVPLGPHNLAVAADGTVAVANPPAAVVSIIEHEKVEEVILGGSPHDVKWAGDLLVVANEGAARLDLISRAGEKRGEVRLKANPHDVAVSEDAGTAWASLDGSDEIAVVNLERRTLRYVSTGQRPHDLLFDARGRAWVTDWGGVVHVFSASAELVQTLELGTEAHHLTFTPDGKEAWITDHGTHQVFVVGTDDLNLRASLPVAGAPHHVAISPNGRLALVADHDNGTLVVYRVATRRKVAEIDVGPGPHGVWAAP